MLTGIASQFSLASTLYYEYFPIQQKNGAVISLLCFFKSAYRRSLFFSKSASHLFYIIIDILSCISAVFCNYLYDALPTIAPSAIFVYLFTCSGVFIPKPTAAGVSVTSFIDFTMLSISVFISLLTPVTPIDDTT